MKKWEIEITWRRHFSDLFDTNSLLGNVDDGQLTFLSEADLENIFFKLENRKHRKQDFLDEVQILDHSHAT